MRPNDTDIDNELRGLGLLPVGSGGERARNFIGSSPTPDIGRFHGALLGTACGDALGRPVERMAPDSIRNQHGVLRDFVGRRGHDSGAAFGEISDDTQLTMWAAEAILDGGDQHPQRFAQLLSDRFESIRGIGAGTRKAILRYSMGTPWWRSGSRSSGNGVAMRAAALGLGFGHALDKLRRETARNAVVTHVDSLAVASGIAQAYAVTRLTRTRVGTLDPHELIAEIVAVLDGYHDAGGIERRHVAKGQWTRLIDRITEIGDMLDLSPSEVFEHTHNGAYVLESLPAALWSFLSRPEDPEAAIVVAVNGGYDADTVGAMTGALAGSYHGAAALPTRWTEGVEEADALTELATRLHIELIGATSGKGDPGTPGSASDADRVHVSVLLDRSGSMQQIATDTIGGFNSFLAEQRALPGQCRVTLVQFDDQDPQEVVVDAVPVAKVPELTPERYQPRSMTPLLDAMGTLIKRVDRRVAADADEFQLVAVITDGLENASRRFQRIQIAEMVKDRSDAGWAFVFLGANLDSFAEADSMGMSRAQAADWDHSAAGVHEAFDALSRSSRRVRSAKGSAAKHDLKDILMDEVRAERAEEDGD